MICGMGDAIRPYIVGCLPKEIVDRLPEDTVVLRSSGLWPPAGKARFGRFGTTVLWWWYMVVTVTRLLFVIWRHGIDIVHANNEVTSNAPAVLAAKLSRRPCVCHLRGMLPPWRETRWLFKHVDRYIPIAKVVERYYADMDLLARDTASVIYNGIDVNGLRDHADRKDRNVDGPFRVAMIGRAIAFKGHTYFLETAAEVVRERADVRFLVYGPIPKEDDAAYPYYMELCRKRDKLCLCEGVEFAGVYTDLAEAMSAVDVVICCSPIDNFGRVLFEAMSCGVPVIAFDSGGIREVAQPGENCILVPNKDASAMARAVVDLVQDPELIHRLVTGGRATAKELFDHRKNAAKVLGLYEQLLDGR